MKIAFILRYKYDHDNNDNAEDHCVSCSWAIISLVTLMSRLKLKKEDRIHKLGEYQPLKYQHIVSKGQLKETKLFNKECVLFKPILTHYLFNPKISGTLWNISPRKFLYKYWFNNYCVPKNEVHSISIAQTVNHIHIPNNFWQQFCPFLIPPKKKKK